MALLWIDGFDNYGTTTAPDPTGIIGRKYPATVAESSMTIVAGRLGGYAVSVASASCSIRKAALTTEDTVVIGLAVKFAASGMFLHLMDGSTEGVKLSLSSGGELVIYRSLTELGRTSEALIIFNAWYYIELKVKCHATLGTYELRVGENVLSDTNVNTQAGTHAYHDGFAIRGTQNGFMTGSFDDLYFLDSSGATNNDFLGNMRVITIRPDAAGDSTAFTPDSDVNYARVLEEVCDDDTSYVESVTTGHQDLYNYAAVPSLADVKGVQVNVDCRETDATSYSLLIQSKLGATTSNGASQAIGTTNYTTKHRIMETDPNANAWTVVNLDAAQFGIKVG